MLKIKADMVSYDMIKIKNRCNAEELPYQWISNSIIKIDYRKSNSKQII